MKGSPTVPTAPITLTGQKVNTAWHQFFTRLTSNVVGGNLYGLFADRPAATDVFPGTLYYVTNTGELFLSTGATWEPFSSSAAGVMVIYTAATEPAIVTDDQAYLFRDTAAPISLYLKFKIAGVTYQIPLAGPL